MSLSACTDSQGLATKRPAHHTENGFQNNYLPPERMKKDFSKLWRWRSNRVEQESVQLELTKADVVFLKQNRTISTLTWIGHSTFLWQYLGTNLITDPHLTQRASPVNFLGPERFVEPGLSLSDLPLIDIVIISHNHYDHLDRKTVLALVEQQAENPPLFLVPLGLKEWFTDIGIIEKVIELDWWQSHQIGSWQLSAVPVQHWSRRGLFDTNQTLWAGWVVEAPEQKMFFAGDTGYSQDFKDIGDRFGSMDLSLIPIGAYAPRWFMQDSHVNPEEAVQIHQDVRSKFSVGMHWGTFLNLTDEPLLEPPQRLKEVLEERQLSSESFITLKHGQTLSL
jgi:L-ascorbate metabolism protein UlaG (beta-lactamase superfamily)